MERELGSSDYPGMEKFYEDRHNTQNSLQILRQENRETVLVNALAFFLHPKRGGGFIDNKILKNILNKTGRIDVKPEELICITTEFPCFELVEGSVPEELNLNSNILRLDIFLEFQNYCVGIEAKIDASVYNDLSSYRKNVETRAKAGRGRDFDTLLLVRQDAKIETKEEWKEWEKITWEEITKGCKLDSGKDFKFRDSVSDLLEALKDIDCGKSNDLSENDLNTDRIDKIAKELYEFLNGKKDDLKSSRIKLWKGDKGLRHIIEPRVVVENHELNFKIDICVGFRGIQFVIFNIKNYDTGLYERICDKYRFYYWQDYEDVCEHYKRYIIGKKDGDDGYGPLRTNVLSVKEEDTIIIKINEEKLNEEVFKKTKELFGNLSNKC